MEERTKGGNKRFRFAGYHDASGRRPAQHPDDVHETIPDNWFSAFTNKQCPLYGISTLKTQLLW